MRLHLQKSERSKGVSSSLKRQPSQSQTSMPAWTKTVLPTSSIIYPNKVKAMVQGRDRRPELAYKLALECRQSDAFVALSLIKNILMMVMMMNHIKPDWEDDDVNHDIVNVTERANTMYYILLYLFTLIFCFQPNTQTIQKCALSASKVFLRKPAVITRCCCLVDDIDSGGNYI